LQVATINAAIFIFFAFALRWGDGYAVNYTRLAPLLVVGIYEVKVNLGVCPCNWVWLS